MMTGIHFIDNNAQSFTLEAMKETVKLRSDILLSLYDTAKITINNLHDYARVANTAKDAKEIAEALEAFRILFLNKDNLLP